MPLIKVQMSVKCENEIKQEICLALSKICADGIGKPEAFVSSIIEDDATIAFGGEITPGAFVVVKSIGNLNSEVNKKLSQMICDCLTKSAGIPGNKIYINFIDVPGVSWGHDSGIFA
jgi:phenylpyruvate tautomerase PptA (4-oxalocrotonate tautomerase family)